VQQRELSLVLIEIDDYDQLFLLHGPDQMFRLVASMQQAIRQLSEVECECMLATDNRYAIVLPECDRRQAVDVARSIIDRLPAWLLDRGETDTQVHCSAGVATLAVPNRSSHPQELIEAADRCLFAARRSGGQVVKSIDVL
jgi:GGDEF domain-containing protein